ncbi:MAG: signal peptidase I [Pseudomonadota bacterium]
MTTRRKPIIAILFSVITLGVGHMYSGYLKKGLILVIGMYIVILLGGLTNIYPTFYGYLLLALLIVSFYIYIIIDAATLANKNNPYELKVYNKWYFYVLAIVSISLLSNYLFSNRASFLGYDTYRVPSLAMEPTIKVGDFFVTNARHESLNIGDVIVFRYPLNREDIYIKRIVGLGGDTIEIKKGKIFINNNEISLVDYDDETKSTHASITMTKTNIPAGHVFTLGDNRTRSADSRHWGFVPENDVLGVATYIWYSKEFKRIGMKIK